MADQLTDALATYLARKDRSVHPSGRFDSASRWQPSDAEWQPCCSRVRPPSRAFPYSLMVHCRTAEHIAALYGVEEAALRKAVRAARPRRAFSAELFKAVAVQDGQFLSIYDGTTEYRLGETRVQRVRREHDGGYYAYETPDAARAADVPSRSVLADAPRAILRVAAEGQHTRYRCDCMGCRSARACGERPIHPDKLAVSRLTPLAVEATL